jgi:hypothetical protein
MDHPFTPFERGVTGQVVAAGLIETEIEDEAIEEEQAA